MTVWLAAATLGVSVLLGALAGALRVFADPERAIDALNRYAIMFAFPTLITLGLMSTSEALPTHLGFWGLVPAVWLIAVVIGRLTMPRHGGTLALTLGFGNIAFLGLPMVEGVLGPSALAMASVVVGIHLLVGLTLGPILLQRWSREGSTPRSAKRLLSQPLLWAPLVGFAARLLPSETRELVTTLFNPVGRSAAPVALFLLGLYLHTHRARLRRVDAVDLGHLAFKLGVLPGLTTLGAWLLASNGMISISQAQIFVILSAMPAAIATFSLARELGAGQDRVSRAVVLGSVVALLTIPGVSWLARSWIATW